MTEPISLADVQAARLRLAPYLTATPCRQYPTLGAALPGATLWVKHENMQPTGSFKVRNGLATITVPIGKGRYGAVPERGAQSSSLLWSHVPTTKRASPPTALPTAT